MEDVNKSLKRTLFKSLRKKKGTQRQVAQDMDITETYVRQLENGQSNPSVELLFSFAYYFETDVYQLWPDLSYKKVISN